MGRAGFKGQCQNSQWLVWKKKPITIHGYPEINKNPRDPRAVQSQLFD
jgi:hypothetical protein